MLARVGTSVIWSRRPPAGTVAKNWPIASAPVSEGEGRHRQQGVLAEQGDQGGDVAGPPGRQVALENGPLHRRAGARPVWSQPPGRPVVLEGGPAALQGAIHP